MPTTEELKEGVISDGACLILNYLTACTDNRTHLTLLKSARYHIGEYHKELMKAKIGIDAIIQIRRQQNNPPISGDNKLSWILQRKCEDMTDILNRLDFSISAYDQVINQISEIHDGHYIPNSKDGQNQYSGDVNK